ncbi:MAG: hypothetical protein ABR583_11275 [Gaiellaceae bacterium]
MERYVNAQAGIAVEYPSGWHATNRPLTGVVWPPQRLVIASYSLDEIAAGPNCSPTPALEALPPDGALIQLIEYTPMSDQVANPGDFPPRPARFRLDGELLQRSECSGLSHSLAFRDAGRKLQAQVWLGKRGSIETRKQVLTVLDSLDIEAP